MATLWAAQALTDSGWAKDVRVVVDASGQITSVTAGAPMTADTISDVLLPAPANAHSHAFQRAMAGLTERRGPNARDTFWTWRELMFRFLDRLTPDHVEAIAAFVQMEMLEAGYATNVEFHYLHHGPGGHPYTNLAEMVERIAAAASRTGIGLTLLPVLYQFGGCDRRALDPGQVRFGNDINRFAKLHEQSATALRALPSDSVVGIAPHSLRAVNPMTLVDLVELHPAGPVHMHLAEQIAEVDEVRAFVGQRPVEWVLDNLTLGKRFTFIHCTQMEAHETEGLARSGATAGLCPITESSLGDGIFDGDRWLATGGSIAIGSDSNIRIALSEELRTLEYSQRLRDRSRAVLASPNQSTGRVLFDAVAKGGATASGRATGAIKAGNWADLVALDHGHIDLEGRQGDTILDSFIFAGDDRMVCDVWSAGRHIVQGGRHVARESITMAYRSAIRELGEAI
ncbi:formimidoylglutamate deiminase [Pelagibius sp.]|uniref:formimidoylglutamate deiminase n=1 Tax=Pelagibius sp. TaxID=1931238 RepID=UPI003BAE74E9